MPHILVVGLTTKIVGFTDDELNQLAGQLSQLTASINNILTFTLKNVGDRPFPGGKIKRIWIEQSSGLGGVKSEPIGDLPAVPKLAVGEEKTVYEWTTAPKLSGLATIEIEVAANDGDTVQLKRFDGDTPKNPVAFFYAVGKAEDILTMHLLEIISNKLDRLAIRKS